MVGGIVSADIFLIFSETDDYYFFKMRPNFGVKASHFNKMNFSLGEFYLLFADKTTENAPALFLCPTLSQNTKNPKAVIFDNLVPIWDQNYFILRFNL